MRAALAAVSSATLLVGGAPLVPGSHIGSAKLVRGTAPKADEKLFDFCNPVIDKAGVYRRSCRLPKVAKLFVGYGAFEPDKAAFRRRLEERELGGVARRPPDRSAQVWHV